MLDLTAAQSESLWAAFHKALAGHATRLDAGRATPAALDPAAVRALIDSFDLERPASPDEAVAEVVEGLFAHQVHPPHPR